ncbi:MAG TPA: mevalonate kinase [Nitrososphaeraceae archaeon]|jgi:mevalonate kinase
MSKLGITSFASAPAKIILFGEHFVVYNNPAILVAIDKRIQVNARLIPDYGIHIHSDLQEPFHYTSIKSRSNRLDEIRNKPLYPIYDAILRSIPDSFETGIDIRIKSEIPVGIGLGSSAASCVSTIAAVENLFKVPERRAICLKAMASETIVHKGSSGADCFASTYGGIIHYIKNQGFSRINVHKIPHLVLLNSGLKHSTRSMVSRVEEFKMQNESKFRELCKRASVICQKGMAAIQSGNIEEVGSLMNENHVLLQTLGASHEKVDELVDLCNRYGALGCKLTGAGGGGSVVALMMEKNFSKLESEAIELQYEVLPVTLDSRGLEIH